MRVLVSILLYGFLLDALLTVLGEWLPIALLRNIVAGSVLVFGICTYLIAAFTARLPKRFVLPAVGFLMWANIAGAFPLAFIASGLFPAIFDWLQLLVAIALLITYQRWSRTPPDSAARSFSWHRLALFAALAFIAAPLLLAAGAIHTVGTYLEARSGGFFKLRPGGMMLEEREFTKDGKTVLLVSMMHIGEKDFYERIHASLPASDSAVVLLEGITDKTGLLKTHFSYSGLAKWLGLTSQESTSLQNAVPASEAAQGGASQPHVRYRHADVDVSVFSPLTIQFINTIGVILSSSSVGDALHAINAANSPFNEPGAEELVLKDILDKRNAHLVSEIDGALKTSQIVIIPWGALHLPFVEGVLEERGFKEVRRTDHVVVRFWKGEPAPAGK
ncbi:MAG: hypothetical protein ACREKL_12720 [Chthoniobacterales bacterium]